MLHIITLVWSTCLELVWLMRPAPSRVPHPALQSTDELEPGTAPHRRLGTVPVAAHQVVYQLWVFASFVVDSLAIAGQTLIAIALGAGRPREAREIADRLLEVSRCDVSLNVKPGQRYGGLFSAGGWRLVTASGQDSDGAETQQWYRVDARAFGAMVKRCLARKPDAR